MRDNKEEYLPFMLNPSTGELYTPGTKSSIISISRSFYIFLVNRDYNFNSNKKILSDQFYKYCEDVEGTSAWGGHLEVKLLLLLL